MPRPKEHAECKCGWNGEIRKDTYKANIKKNGEYTCQKCAAKKAGAEGKYCGDKETRSTTSKELWKSPEYRDKITNSNTNGTEEYKAKQSQRSQELWKSDEYRRKIIASLKIAMNDQITKNKISDGLKKKWDESSYRTSIISNLKRQKISSLQTTLYEYLENLNIPYHKEGDNTLIGYYSFDCMIPHSPKNILIECQGNYWHSLPKAIRNDRAKFTYINKYFPEYEIMYIWEHEFNTKDRVLDRLKLKLGIEIQTKSFEFSELKQVQINRDISNQFLENYHYLTKSRGGNDFGLFHDNILIGVCRFSPLPRQNMSHQFPDGAVELSRMCIHPNYHKKNLISWWLSKLVKNYNAVVSFADTTVGHTGSSYKAANFKLHHVVEPDYWYVDKDGYVMHKKTLYNKAINLKMTESEYADLYGFVKKWGGHKMCFVYYRQ